MKVKKIQLSVNQMKSIKNPAKSHSPQANKDLVSIKMHKKSLDKGKWLWEKMGDLYDCKDKSKVKIDGKCYGHKNKKAQERMLELLNYRDINALKVDYVKGPPQILSNCWLNSFFMCYFISDKGRKFFRHFRYTMITGRKSVGGAKIEDKFREGLWLLNKIIQAALFNFYSDTNNKYNAEKFMNHVDTNDVIRLLRGKGDKEEKRIVKSKKAHNPVFFYEELFNILGLNAGSKLNWSRVNYRDVFNEIMGKTKRKFLKKDYKPDLFVIERRDDSVGGFIDSKKDKVPKSFTYNGVKYVLDSAVLRSIDKKHFTSYVTIGKYGYGFEGGAHRRLRPMDEWKDLLVKGTNETWSFGSPLNSKKLSQKKEGYILNEKFNFTKGYQILFYYRV